MAYPDPTPVIRGRKNVKEFLRRLDNFTLTPEQMKFYADGFERHKRRRLRDSGPPTP
jgi:hypothetical protein